MAEELPRTIAISQALVAYDEAVEIYGPDSPEARRLAKAVKEILDGLTK